jgi:4-nitrophenyl phosphatase
MPNNLDLNEIQALVIDMDGVLWRGNDPLPGLIEFFDLLHTRSIPFMLATNNATKTPAQYVQKLAGFGVMVRPASILTSSLATAAYLQQEFNPGATVYVLGQDGLREAMQDAGFSLVDDASRPADIVVAGLDTTLTYEKLKHAALLIRRGARFVGSNGDLAFPAEEGLAPGAGAILAALEAATGVAPIVIGKPERLMFDIAVQKLGSRPEQTAMLGDRLETDILGGQRAGLKTILVTTGVDNEDSIPQKDIHPDAVFSGIQELTQVMQGSSVVG